MNIYALAALLSGLLLAARTKLTFTVYGSAVAMPVLWLVVAFLVLVIAALALYLVRGIVRDWPAPRMVPA